MSFFRLCKRAAALLLCAAFVLVLPLTPVQAADGKSAHDILSGPVPDAAVVATLLDGETVTLLRNVAGGWSFVRLADGSVGYCPSDCLRELPDGAVSSALSIVKTRSSLSLYAKADTSSTVLDVLPANLYLKALSDESDGYCLVETASGKRGYLNASGLERVSAVRATLCTRPKLSARGAVTEEEAEAKLQELSSFFLDGLYWNHHPDLDADPADTLFEVTSTPCDHTNEGYAYCNYYVDGPEVLSEKYGTLTQCMGYCSLLSDLVFGTDAPITFHFDLDRIRVGDQLRFRDYEHSVLVAEILENADGTRSYRLTEVNKDYETCEIDWDRVVTKIDLLSLGDEITVITRYPVEESQ